MTDMTKRDIFNKFAAVILLYVESVYNNNIRKLKKK